MRSLFIAILVVGGLVGLVAWRAAPWLMDSGSQQAATVNLSASTEAAPPAVVQNSARKDLTRLAPETKPEATEGGASASQTKRSQAGRPNSRPALSRWGVAVSTIPSDATAILDNFPDVSCKTPCLLPASRGIHRIAISHAGYQTEYRQAAVTTSRLDLPVIALRPSGGLLMATSVPAGAKIFLDGRDSEEVTPAKLQLPPGTHNVAVEKDGKRAGEEVQVLNGIITYVRIPLDR